MGEGFWGGEGWEYLRGAGLRYRSGFEIFIWDYVSGCLSKVEWTC